MRIAFDLDHTLIDWGGLFPLEPSMPLLLLRPWFREPLRQGTRDLLQTLKARGHDIWIYTTSGRDPIYLWCWFALLGVRLGGIVNCHGHDAKLREGHIPRCSKFPPAFGIDLLIDDSEGVREEGRLHGFDVLLLPTDAKDWTERILTAVTAREPNVVRR